MISSSLMEPMKGVFPALQWGASVTQKCGGSHPINFSFWISTFLFFAAQTSPVPWCKWQIIVDILMACLFMKLAEMCLLFFKEWFRMLTSFSQKWEGTVSPICTPVIARGASTRLGDHCVLGIFIGLDVSWIKDPEISSYICDFMEHCVNTCLFPTPTLILCVFIFFYIPHSVFSLQFLMTPVYTI